ncbi:MAG: 16S rRNA (cytosine(1402)-N(4))-methyltransferase [Candidatus Peribacteria bacterium]|nr:MAG: 16S rRNA (cytosine(1402)-N(4))-methyltransferase [Candidatus Peribacteria bacterium]
MDMRYDRTQGKSAKERLQQVRFPELFACFQTYTDFSDKYCTWIAEELLVAVKKSALSTTRDLSIRAEQLGINDKKLAVIFQAIRITVNNELGELELFLQKFPGYLRTGGRCAIMTYHSIEDRMVKIAFKELVASGRGDLVNKKVLTADRKEVKKNKAARSAKFRVFELY